MEGCRVVVDWYVVNAQETILVDKPLKMVGSSVKPHEAAVLFTPRPPVILCNAR
jgi:hypothetical protein